MGRRDALFQRKNRDVTRNRVNNAGRIDSTVIYVHNFDAHCAKLLRNLIDWGRARHVVHSVVLQETKLQPVLRK